MELRLALIAAAALAVFGAGFGLAWRIQSGRLTEQQVRAEAAVQAAKDAAYRDHAEQETRRIKDAQDYEESLTRIRAELSGPHDTVVCHSPRPAGVPPASTPAGSPATAPDLREPDTIIDRTALLAVGKSCDAQVKGLQAPWTPSTSTP